MKAWILGACAVLVAWPAAAGDLYRPKMTQIWSVDGFQEPESVVLEPRESVLYVSNMNGDATAKDGNGYISKLSTDGRILSKAWVSGLNAPKGLAVVHRKLFVADIDELVEITRSNGEKKIYPAPGAKFLNDVTSDLLGRVYVSDMLDDSIYRASAGKFTLWLKDPKLAGPNGLWAEKTRLIVGSWGVMTDGFKTAVPGHLLVTPYAKRKITDLGDGRPVGNIDGVVPDGRGNYFVTDWMNGNLYLVSPSGESLFVKHLGEGAADLFYLPEEGIMLVPLMKEGRVVAYTIDWP